MGRHMEAVPKVGFIRRGVWIYARFIVLKIYLLILFREENRMAGGTYGTASTDLPLP